MRRAVVHLLKVEGISIFLLTQSLTTTIYICQTRTPYHYTALVCACRFFFIIHKGAPTSNILPRNGRCHHLVRTTYPDRRCLLRNFQSARVHKHHVENATTEIWFKTNSKVSKWFCKPLNSTERLQKSILFNNGF